MFAGLVAGLVSGLALAYALSSAGPDPRSVRALAPSGAPLRPAAATGLESPGGPTPAGGRQAVTRAATDSAPVISEERLQAVLARIEVEPIELASGTGEVSGQVTDPEGVGVAGVVVQAHVWSLEAFHYLYSSLFGRVRSNTVSERPPELSLESSVREAARTHSFMRATMFETRTDSGGHYRFEGLPRGNCPVQAYKRGFSIDPLVPMPWDSEGTPMGMTINFVARPVLSVPVRVLLPDGSLAKEAVVVSSVELTGRPSKQSHPWTPDDDALRLVAYEVELRAFAGAPLDSFPNDMDAADFRSPSVRVQLAHGAPASPVELQLDGRLGIRGRVVFAEDRIIPSHANVRLLRLTSGGGVDLDALMYAKPEAWVGGGEEFAFLELAAGQYAVGIKRSRNGHVTAHRVVEVGSGIVRCDFEVPPIDPRDFLVVRALGPDGEPLDRMQFEFRWKGQSESRYDGGSRQGRVRDTDGTYYLAIPQGVRSAFLGDAPSDDLLQIQATHPKYGSKSPELRAGQREVTILFSAPARLDVLVTGHDDSRYLGRVAVSLTPAAGDSQFRGGSGREELGREGAARFEALEPGGYVVTLLVRPRGERASFGTVAALEVELSPGENSVQMVLTRLYSLEVIVPGAEEGSSVHLSRIIEGEGASGSSWYARCDLDGRVHFEDLPTGEYTLRARGDKRGEMRIDVPGGAVVFEPDGR